MGTYLTKGLLASMTKDCIDNASVYEKCQKHGNIQHIAALK